MYVLGGHQDLGRQNRRGDAELCVLERERESGEASRPLSLLCKVGEQMSTLHLREKR